MPASTNGSVIHAPLGYFPPWPFPPGVGGGGAKHSSFVHCPANGRMYVFGGDYPGYASDADKAANQSNVDFQNQIWSYDAAADDWRLEKGWDCGDGKIQPWRADWGHFPWDSKRNVFWYLISASGSITNSGSFPYQAGQSSGLNISIGPGRVFPQETAGVTTSTRLVLPDNSMTRIYYDPVAHKVNLTGGQYPIYDVTTAGGRIASAANLRPWWMTYGSGFDNIDPRHYAYPTSLITWNPLGGDVGWTDSGIAHAEDVLPGATTSADGRRWHPSSQNMSMVYDEAQDQLISFGNTYAVHVNLTTGKWSYYPQNTPQLALQFARPWFDPESRKVWVIEPAKVSNGANPLLASLYAYDVDAHVFSRVCDIAPHQQGPSNTAWTNGIPSGPMTGWHAEPNCPLMHDAVNEILWMVEVESPYLNPYGFGGSGRVCALHAVHYQENPVRHERIVPSFDPGNPPHGLVWGIDPVNNLIMGYGHNAPAVDPKSTYYATMKGLYDPVVYQRPALYCWTPSGFTKAS